MTRTVCRLSIVAMLSVADAQVPALPTQVSIRQALASHGVSDASTGSLIAALKSPQPEVRGLAALRIAEMNKTSAVPDMEEAFATEKDRRAVLDIGTALLRFRSAEASRRLEQVCFDSDAPAKEIIEISDALRVYGMGSHPEICGLSLLRIAASPLDNKPWVRANALEVLAGFQHIPANLSDGELDLGPKLLSDPDPAVRSGAIRMLSSNPSSRALELLRVANQQEKNPSVKNLLTNSLEKVRSAGSQSD